MASTHPSAAVPRMALAELSEFLARAFPESRRPLGEVTIVAPGHVRMVLTPDATMLRPGGIVSGPTLMALADVAAYALVLAHIGPVAMAVTNALNIQFLRPCPPDPITADARLLRLGRRLANSDVRIWTASEDRLAAQASVTYALPG